MKIDIAGPERRGLATGLNEFSGYLAVGIAAYASAEIAAAYGLRMAPFALGILVAGAGLALSCFFVHDTRGFVEGEMAAARKAGGANDPDAVQHSEPQSLGTMFALTWRDRRFFACHQAGMVNNLNDALAWALFPLFFASLGFSLGTIGLLAALYPAVWGLANRDRSAERQDRQEGSDCRRDARSGRRDLRECPVRQHRVHRRRKRIARHRYGDGLSPRSSPR